MHLILYLKISLLRKLRMVLQCEKVAKSTISYYLKIWYRPNTLMAWFTDVFMINKLIQGTFYINKNISTKYYKTGLKRGESQENQKSLKIQNR
jgi:uncharacterized membrane protein YciS (DUF1049 family)